MSTHWTLNMIWWVTAIEIPALAGLFWLIWRTRQDVEIATRDLHRRVDQGHDRDRMALADFKVEVAKSYASIEHLREVEDRLTAHLLRIEAKLDVRPPD